MAHSKTTPLHVLTQTGAGLAVFGVCYYSLFSNKSSSTDESIAEEQQLLTPEPQSAVAQPSSRTQQAQGPITQPAATALDAEAKRTSGWYWKRQGQD